MWKKNQKLEPPRSCYCLKVNVVYAGIYAGPESTHSWWGCTRWFGLILRRNQTQQSSIRSTFIHTPLIWSTTYERDKVFDINHWTRSMKQTPTQASSCGRRTHIVRQCGRVRVSVTECMTAYQNKGFEEDYTDSTGPHHSPPRATKSGGRCPHDNGERRPVQDEDIPAFGSRWKTQAPWIWLRSFLRFGLVFFWFWTTVFNWVSQSTGRIRTKQKTNGINRSIQINTGKLEQLHEPQGQKPML